MKKTLSLLLALVMVIGLFPVFADEAKVLTAEEAGAILQGYGAIKGGSDGDLMIDKELKRQDAVVILTRLMGKETDALATQAAPSFEDITIDYYKPFLAFAEANKWVEGKKEKTFGFNDVVTAKEFAAMLLRALGHDTTGENYPKVMELAKELKLFNGATVEENAPIVRGIAFILMNNTLETAPKGEDKALVYKLGYKEEPKPQGFVVTEAKAAGRKAIDISFSKAVDEKTLFNIDLSEGPKSVNIDKTMVSADGMTVRVVLEKAAKQDALYNLTVASVKTVDGKETVENFEAKVSMTDQVRPEVKGVEVLNPKTFIVKTSEPIDFTTMKSFSSLKNFKISGKELTVKIMNAYKDEIIVELYSALKPGDYKLEVSGLRDFDGLIAKTEEFDITVVEDKEAPVIASARMITVQEIELTFNEPVKTKGAYKVNGHNIAPSKVMIDEDDAKVVYIELVKELDLAAITEISVQHKDQKDAMGNYVKDWTKFTFNVTDDTEIPVVEGVSVSGTSVMVRFNKPMYQAGKFHVKNAQGKYVQTGTAHTGWYNNKTVFRFAAPIFASQNAKDFTLVLEGFKDGTVRGNKLPTTELPFVSKDLKNPDAVDHYVLGKNGDYITAHIFFDEDMDVSSLEDPKNYTFKEFKYAGKVYKDYRADGALAALTFTVKNGSKEVIIEADSKDIQGFGDIRLLGQKDLAGNLLPEETVKPRAKDTKTQYVKEAQLVRGEDKNGYHINVEFADGVKTISGEVFSLVDAADNPISKLTLFSHSENSNEAVFKVESPEKVSTSATTVDANGDATAVTLKLKLVKGENAVSVYGENANEKDKLGVGAVAKVIADKVAPRLTDAALNGDIKIDEKGTRKQIGSAEKLQRIFDEKLVAGTKMVDVSSSALGYNEEATVVTGANASHLTVNKAMAEGVYVVQIARVEDAAGNRLENVSFIVTVGDSAAAKLVSIKPTIVAGGNITEVTVEFDRAIFAAAVDIKADVAVKLEHEAANATIGTSASVAGNKLVITGINANHSFKAAGTVIKVEVKNDQLTDALGNVLLKTEAKSETLTAAKIVNIVSAKKGTALNQTNGELIVEFDRELAGAPAIANIEVTVNGAAEAKYNDAAINPANEKQLVLKSNADNLALKAGDVITVQIKVGHALKDKGYVGVNLVDGQVTPAYTVPAE